ncbi:MAG: hypothetical protein IJA97_04550 [Clostridia bacterium]|nr:hypothetical protein [Clostridia bacterium]
MNNDYLRITNPDALTDTTVNKYSAKANAKLKSKKQNVSSTLDLIIDEVYDFSDRSELIYQESVKKPKILDAIFFSFVYLALLIIVAILVGFIKNLVLVHLLAVASAFYIPLSFIYFFSRLDVRGNVKFSTIAYCTIIGLTIYFLIDMLFDALVSPTMHFYMDMVTVRCVIELLSVVLLSVFIIEGKAKGSKSTAVLIACCISSGFALAQSLSNNFSSMLVKVDVYMYGSSVGAIVNLESFIESSANRLIETMANSIVLEPLTFTMLAMILVNITASEEWSFGKRTVTMLFTFLFCCLTYVLTTISTPFNVLSIFYNVISLVFCIYLFIKMINSCIASEKYEES